MKIHSSKTRNARNLILDILFLLSGISLFLFYKNMFFLHIIVVSLMKKHPEYSQKIISNLNFLSEIIPTVFYHHKRFDNKGYPVKNLEGKVPLTAGILAVADAFDAMTSDRSYRDKLELEQALGELEKGSGTQFDPKVVEAFKRIKSLRD